MERDANEWQRMEAGGLRRDSDSGRRGRIMSDFRNVIHVWGERG